MENPFEELAALLREVKEDQQIIKAKLEKLESMNGDSEDLVTRFEKAKQLQVSLATLNNWDKTGVMPAIKKGRKVFYYKNDPHPKKQKSTGS
jgi:hypothetical protein